LIALAVLLFMATPQAARHGTFDDETGPAPAAHRDHGRFFDVLSAGMDGLVRSDMNPAVNWMFDRMAQELGITDVRITRGLFARYHATTEPAPTLPADPAVPSRIEAARRGREARLADLETERHQLTVDITTLRDQQRQAARPAAARGANDKLDQILGRLDAIERRLGELEKRLPPASVPRKARDVPPNLFDGSGRW
jgi:hypothetical protein